VGIKRVNSAREREIRTILKTGRSGVGPAEVGAWVQRHHRRKRRDHWKFGRINCHIKKGYSKEKYAEQLKSFE
jgi:hypothetical protein